ncbi:hypothetical protein PTKIN_Ptkin14bG0218500 [Pterospermum kingtungense]
MALTRLSLPLSLLVLSTLLVIAFAADYGYDVIPAGTPQAKPAEYNSKPNGEEKPNYADKPTTYNPNYAEKPSTYSLTMVKNQPLTSPILKRSLIRALAKVTCEAVDEVGVEKTVPICSVATDATGYFYATVSSINESLKLKDCKAFLESSPEQNCNVPTDVNKGITGFPISGDVYRVLHDNHTKLYSAQSFFYTSEPKPAPSGY